MGKLTYEEIIAILEQNMSVREFAHQEFDSDDMKLGKITEIKQKGGEGEGEYWMSVKHFPDHDVYIKVEGFYSSYEGTEFEDWKTACSQVKPQQKTVTVYV